MWASAILFLVGYGLTFSGFGRIISSSAQAVLFFVGLGQIIFVGFGRIMIIFVGFGRIIIIFVGSGRIVFRWLRPGFPLVSVFILHRRSVCQFDDADDDIFKKKKKKK